MISSKTKIGLLVAGHVVAGLFLAWASHFWPGPTTIGLYGLVVAEAGLIPIVFLGWHARSPNLRILRILAFLAVIAYLAVLMAISADDKTIGFQGVLATHFISLLFFVTMIMVVLAVVGWRLKIALVQIAISSTDGIRFSIRHLLVVTTGVAVLLAIGTGNRVASGGGALLLAAIVAVLLSVCVLAIAILWATLRPGRPATRLALVLLLAILFGTLPPYYGAGAMADVDSPFVDWPAMFGLQTLVAFASLLVARSCGWRVLRTSALGPLVLKSRQVDLLRAFYGTLGIKLAEEKHESGPSHYSAKIGGVVFSMHPLADGEIEVDATTQLGFAVADLTKVVEELRASGSPVVEQPKATAWGHRAVVRDPDGRTVELYQR